MFDSFDQPLLTFSPTLVSMTAKVPGSYLSSFSSPRTLCFIKPFEDYQCPRLPFSVLTSRGPSLWSHTHPWFQLWLVHSTHTFLPEGFFSLQFLPIFPASLLTIHLWAMYISSLMPLSECLFHSLHLPNLQDSVQHHLREAFWGQHHPLYTKNKSRK